jgi:hypothetical protein
VSATVVCLDSRRRSQPPACGCGRHRLEALTARALGELERSVGELLIDREVVAVLVDDLVATVSAALESRPEGQTRL